MGRGGDSLLLCPAASGGRSPLLPVLSAVSPRVCFGGSLWLAEPVQ